MSQTTGSESMSAAQGKQPGPPLPEFIFKVANPLMKLILNSPLHGLMSKRLMVLSFTGRKSGRRFSTPVGYVREGDKVFVFTHSAWRHNFLNPAQVSMRIQGKDMPGKAVLVTDPEQIRHMVQALSAANGAEMAQRMGFWVENSAAASPEEIRKATTGTYFIEIKTGSGAG